MNDDSRGDDKSYLLDVKGFLTVELLFSDDSIKKAVSLCGVLREYLARIRFQYAAHPDKNKASCSIASSVFDSLEDQEYAIE